MSVSPAGPAFARPRIYTSSRDTLCARDLAFPFPKSPRRSVYKRRPSDPRLVGMEILTPDRTLPSVQLIPRLGDRSGGDAHGGGWGLGQYVYCALIRGRSGATTALRI
jgi:hypothetical protein